VKSVLVNWLPWSVLKISDLPNRNRSPPLRYLHLVVIKR
jgi:hypothetical protein